MKAPKLHVKKGDTVMVIAGKDRGKKGKILTCIPSHNRVVVEGINMTTRHVRPTQKSPKGGITEQEAPLYSSNVKLICPSCKGSARTGKRVLDNGKKARVCKKCKETIDR